MKVFILLLFCSIMVAIIFTNIYLSKNKEIVDDDIKSPRLDEWRIQFFGTDKYYFGKIYNSPFHEDGQIVKMGPVIHEEQNDVVMSFIYELDYERSLAVDLGSPHN